MGTYKLSRCCWLLGIAILIPTASFYAQGKTISLNELIAAAINSYPSIKQKNALVNSAKAYSTDVQHSFLPQIRVSEQLSLGTDNSLPGSYLPIGITPSTSSGIRSQNDMQSASGNIGVMYGEFTLLNFGLNKARLNSANAATRLEESDYAKEIYETELAVSRYYFQLLKLQHRLNVERENVDRYKTVFNIIKKMSASGLIAGADSSLALAELSKSRVNYNQTSGILLQLKIQISALTGIPKENINIVQSNAVELALPSANRNWKADSLSNPLLMYYQRKRDVLVANELLIKKEFLPKLVLAGASWLRGSSIQFNDQYKSLMTGLKYQRFNYAFGVGFSYPILNGLYKRDKMSINRFQIEASENELLNRKLTLSMGLSQAEAASATSEINLAEMPTQLKAAHDIYNQKLAQYKAGIISLIDLTNASFVLYRSETDYLDFVADWYLAELSRAAYSGALNQFIQSIK